MTSSQWCAAAAVLLLAACSTPRPAAPSTVDVSLEVTQYRRDQADRVVAVKVTNRAADDLRVQALELVSPLFDGPGRAEKDSVVPAGQSVDLRLPYGEPECSVDAAEDYQARLWLSAEEPASSVSTAGATVLQRIHDRECDAKEALAAAPLVWGNEWQRVGGGETLVVDGVLHVGPVSGDAVEIVELGSTTMFALSSAVLPVRVEPGATGALPVTFTAQRCDPHAFADNKRGMYFDIRLSVGGAEPLLVTVPPDAAGQEFLLAAALDRCGLS